MVLFRYGNLSEKFLAYTEYAGLGIPVDLYFTLRP